MGGRGSASAGGKAGARNSANPISVDLGPVGASSPNGEMKHITLYHGSFADFEEFDYSKKTKMGSDLQGAGFYFTADPKVARMFGDKIYTVDVAYSTDWKTAKRTGREKDFQYDPKSGYWVIPANKASNLKILNKEFIG